MVDLDIQVDPGVCLVDVLWVHLYDLEDVFHNFGLDLAVDLGHLGVVLGNLGSGLGDLELGSPGVVLYNFQAVFGVDLQVDPGVWLVVVLGNFDLGSPGLLLYNLGIDLGSLECDLRNPGVDLSDLGLDLGVVRDNLGDSLVVAMGYHTEAHTQLGVHMVYHKEFLGILLGATLDEDSPARSYNHTVTCTCKVGVPD